MEGRGEKMYSLPSLRPNRLTGWTDRWREEGERSGEMDRMATEVFVYIFKPPEE